MDSINSTTITGEYSIGSGCIANVEFNSIQEVDFDGSIRLIHKIGDLFYFVKDDIVLTVSTPMGQIWKSAETKYTRFLYLLNILLFYMRILLWKYFISKLRILVYLYCGMNHL